MKNMNKNEFKKRNDEDAEVKYKKNETDQKDYKTKR